MVACSFQSKSNTEPQPACAGFHQSDDEFLLDTLCPRDRAAVFRAIGEVDVRQLEPETAVFLRGFLVGEFHFFK